MRTTPSSSLGLSNCIRRLLVPFGGRSEDGGLAQRRNRAGVDAGSAGVYNLSALRRSCTSFTPLHTRAFLNISTIGLVAETARPGERTCATVHGRGDAIQENREFVVGVKCRLDRSAAVESAGAITPCHEAAGAGGVSVMATSVRAAWYIDEVLDTVAPRRPCHPLHHRSEHGSKSTEHGPASQSAVRARERGALFDVGHGAGGFSFTVAEATWLRGLSLTFTSSDLHQRSILARASTCPPVCRSSWLWACHWERWSGRRP